MFTIYLAENETWDYIYNPLTTSNHPKGKSTIWVSLKGLKFSRQKS